MQAIPVYILAGGQSSRFGSDKALAMLDGEPLIQRIARTIKPLASQITIIAERPEKYAQLGLSTIADLQPGLGPLGGLCTALEKQAAFPASEDWLLLLSCDLLRVQTHWVHQLWQHRTDGSLAVAFKPERWQPLLALYHRDAYPLADRCLHTQDRSLQSLLRQLKAVAAPLPSDWPTILQANRPEDLPGQKD